MLSWESGSKVDRTLLKHCGAAKSRGILLNEILLTCKLALEQIGVHHIRIIIHFKCTRQAVIIEQYL